MASDFDRSESSSFDRLGGRNMDENDINQRGNEGRDNPAERANPRSSSRSNVPDSSLDPSQRDDDDFDLEIETTARPVGSSPPASSNRRSAARNIAARQALVTNPSSSGDRSRDRSAEPPTRSARTGPARTEPERSGRRARSPQDFGPPQDVDRRQEFDRTRSRRYDAPRDPRASARTFAPPERSRFSDRGPSGRDYGRRPSGGDGGGFDRGGFGGGSGGSGGGTTGSSGRPFKLGGVTILIIAILVAFFSGFAMRDLYAAQSGFDDERYVRAEQVPANLREFCVGYNGLPSFTLMNLASNSVLSATTVPIHKLDTCTIPRDQTANALQELGINRRSTSIGLQLGGSNLTLVNLEQVIRDADTLELQNIIRTKLDGVYAIAPGHTYQLQPDIQAPDEIPPPQIR
ncbi:MAG: hypothetical protein AAGM36_14080 [Cyanobacteria bacterium J06597_1]